MSAKITVIDGERCYRLQRNLAARKVRRGGFEWRGQFLIVALPRLLPSAATALSRPFRFGPAASFTDWAPRESSGFLVMQLHTSRRQTA